MNLVTSSLLTSLLCLSLGPQNADDSPLAEYFRIETARIASKPLRGFDTAVDWKTMRPRFQGRLKEMLGLLPEPPRGDLHVELRGTVERPEFVVEKIVYQSLPGLFVTADLYRPKTPQGRLPAILYVCGHSRVEKNGVIYGNKTHYQHHAAWFAANGYVCLIVDTLELGEDPGVHHGTYSQGRWWWLSRGYTPAGVEAWNAVRGIDYLVSRPDVNPLKIGVTGRSGGGATAWWVGAIDDRVAAVCAVAGITDRTNHVVDGVVDGHCDCMYFANTYRWDDAMVAALVAPKPLFIENTDKDPIFPESGVRRIFAHLEKVYKWYDAGDRLSLLIGKGGHADTEELRLPEFAFFEKWLKGKDDPKITEPDRKVPIEALKVLVPGEKLAGSRNATIDESFIAKAAIPDLPISEEDWIDLKAHWMDLLRMKVVAGWPTDVEAGALNVKVVKDIVLDSLRLRIYEWNSQPGIRLQAYLFTRVGDERPKTYHVKSLDEVQFQKIRRFLDAIGSAASGKNGPTVENVPGNPKRIRLNLAGKSQSVKPETLEITAGENEGSLFVVPRGIGPTSWAASKDTQVRRRFMLLGQTLDGMRAYDLRRAMTTILEIEGRKKEIGFSLEADRGACATTILAALFEPAVKEVRLKNPPSSFDDGPALWSISRWLEMPQFAAMLYPIPVVIEGEPGPWKWTENLGQRLDPQSKWPEFSPTKP